MNTRDKGSIVCDVCSYSLVNSQVNLMNYHKHLRRLEKATGFGEYVKSVQSGYGIPRHAAVRVAREVWIRKDGFFRAPFQLEELKRLHKDPIKKTAQCHRLICELDVEIKKEQKLLNRL